MNNPICTCHRPAPAPSELRRAPKGLLSAGCLLLSAAAADVSLTTGLTGMAGLARAASAALADEDDDEELGGTGVCHGLDLLCV